MGVAIYGLSNIDLVAKDDGSLSETMRIHAENQDSLAYLYVKDFPGHADGFPSDWYNYDDNLHIMSRSYGGYNAWRNELCKLVHGVTAQDFWKRCYTDDAFYWLINFSDCEGFIGPNKCKILLADFLSFKGLLKTQFVNGEIDHWISILKTIAGNGVIKFS